MLYKPSLFYHPGIAFFVLGFALGIRYRVCSLMGRWTAENVQSLILIST
jgi:hypothetical protein